MKDADRCADCQEILSQGERENAIERYGVSLCYAHTLARDVFQIRSSLQGGENGNTMVLGGVVVDPAHRGSALGWGAWGCL